MAIDLPFIWAGILAFAVFAYVVTAFVVHPPWMDVLRSTVFPSISFDAKYLSTLIAVLGTTISPYLFFWQASQEAEEVRVTRGEQALRKSSVQISIPSAPFCL